MKLSVFSAISALIISFSLYAQVPSASLTTPATYIKNFVEQKMGTWSQQYLYESTKDYAVRTSEANKAAMRKEFETEATAKYKELFIQNSNWSQLLIAGYDDNKQSFLIKSAACADFMMPVPRAQAAEFEANFPTCKKTDPDFYFDGDVVKFSKLIFTDSRGKQYVYNMAIQPALAEISWQSPVNAESGVNSKDLKIQACVKSESSITDLSVVVNGETTRGISAVANDGCDFTVNQRVTLINGMNVIKIIAKNNAGQSISEVRYVNYQPSKTSNTTPGATQANSKRLALVMGNAAYSLFPLANPVNDATDMADKLKGLGFDVILMTDKTRKEMQQAMDYFDNRAKGYDVVLFFYAGHAIQCSGKNYLIPVDADLKDEQDVEYECTPVNRILAKMEDTSYKLKIIILDACRNNPFERSWRSMGGSGLSFVNAPKGSFVAYSTAPNEVAQDGKDRNSPYTSELLKNLDVKDLKIEEFFKLVREGVLKKTDGRQVPWDQSSIVGDFYFNQ